ncbi:MAG: hypothetical protein H0T73_19495 [Ardenticatenales bacterium]|nr:hypothetical protein [Ardenticatenales bacterium]
MHKGLQRAAGRDRKRRNKRKMAVSGRSVFTCLKAQAAREAHLVAGNEKANGRAKRSKNRGKAR